MSGYPITVTITKTLEPWWGSEEDFAEMPDDEIVELCHEDPLAILEDATWVITREGAA